MRKKKIALAGLILWCSELAAHAQEAAGLGPSIQAAAGIGVHEGKVEKGLGAVYALGYQTSGGATARWRFNPQLVWGEFSAGGFTDSRDQFYRTTAASMLVHYDVLRYRAVAVVVSGGGAATYARGLLGTGGELQPLGQGSRYFKQFYLSGSTGLGLRVSPPQSRLAYEFRPFTLQAGTQGFSMGYATVGLAVRLRG